MRKEILEIPGPEFHLPSGPDTTRMPAPDFLRPLLVPLLVLVVQPVPTLLPTLVPLVSSGLSEMLDIAINRNSLSLCEAEASDSF